MRRKGIILRMVPMVTGACIVLACTPAVTTKKPVVEKVPHRPVTIVYEDTLVYEIVCADHAERERFVYSFNRFLKEHSFLAERYDSAGVLTILRIMPVAPQRAAAGGSSGTIGLPRGDTAWLDSLKHFQEVREEEGEDSLRPPFGGSLRLYTPREVLDYPVTMLLDAYPFSERRGGDSLRGYLRVEKASPTVLTLKLDRTITSGTGKKLTVLDIVSIWTKHCRARPGEARALFYACQGINEFTSGREAVIRGISAIDKSTISIRLSKTDPLALDRLRTGRAMPAPFGLGPYAVKLTRENEDVLVANRTAAGASPFVNEALVRRGGDANPILSFSLGRYDAMLLWKAADLEYARRNLMKGGTCTLVGSDRYFIAVQLEDVPMRDRIAASFSAAEMFEKFVKAEGSLITAVASDTLRPPLPEKTKPQKGDGQDKPVSIYYIKGDPVSKIIAERLLASVTRVRITADLFASDRHSYEAALIGRTPGCFIGWVPKTVLVDPSEKLKFATVYFNNEDDETAWIPSRREIPLFSVDWYLLAKEKIGLYKGALNGIYVKQEEK
ncbi:MAG: hypothetical protein JW768_15080 [Chitinispirillaceae bacterium]|nr:hypothetical protein [Chitinispirillaceae bacterium]